jgi:hypothetical protein
MRRKRRSGDCEPMKRLLRIIKARELDGKQGFIED